MNNKSRHTNKLNKKKTNQLIKLNIQSQHLEFLTKTDSISITRISKLAININLMIIINTVSGCLIFTL